MALEASKIASTKARFPVHGLGTPVNGGRAKRHLRIRREIFRGTLCESSESLRLRRERLTPWEVQGSANGEDKFAYQYQVPATNFSYREVEGQWTEGQRPKKF